jgi:7-cyano-7-deazaguanine synthase
LKAIGGSALIDAVKIEMGEGGLPNTFVPGRNVMFLTAAAALGYRRGISDLVGGMCETDFSGYPDCRDDTVKAMQLALNLGMERRVGDLAERVEAHDVVLAETRPPVGTQR